MTTADPGSTPILIAYDGSSSARAAIEEAGRLFAGAVAEVATVWTSVRSSGRAARAALPQSMIDEAVRNLDATARHEAEQTAEEGAAAARAAGLDATAVVLRADASVWERIIRHAEDAHVAAVVVGSRGLSAIRSALLGSVSSGVIHHCRRPVVVVHPAEGGGEP